MAPLTGIKIVVILGTETFWGVVSVFVVHSQK